jgi:hypothetical protein
MQVSPHGFPVVHCLQQSGELAMAVTDTDLVDVFFPSETVRVAV